MEGTHKSPKVVDFVESAPFAEAISKATPHKKAQQLSIL